MSDIPLLRKVPELVDHNGLDVSKMSYRDHVTLKNFVREEVRRH